MHPVLCVDAGRHAASSPRYDTRRILFRSVVNCHTVEPARSFRRVRAARRLPICAILSRPLDAPRVFLRLLVDGLCGLPGSLVACSGRVVSERGHHSPLLRFTFARHRPGDQPHKRNHRPQTNNLDHRAPPASTEQAPVTCSQASTQLGEGWFSRACRSPWLPRCFRPRSWAIRSSRSRQCRYTQTESPPSPRVLPRFPNTLLT